MGKLQTTVFQTEMVCLDGAGQVVRKTPVAEAGGILHEEHATFPMAARPASALPEGFLRRRRAHEHDATDAGNINSELQGGSGDDATRFVGSLILLCCN